MKKLLTLTIAAIMAVACCFGLVGCGKMVDDGEGVTIAGGYNVAADYSYLDPSKLASKTLNVGAILVGDESEGYSLAHMNGIDGAKARLEALGATVNVVYEKKVGEDAACNAKINTLAANNDIVITNSYGHQFQYGDGQDAVYTKFPNVTFISMTGDLAKEANVDNYKNAFTQIYQSRYVSGVVAGIKLKQLVDDNLLSQKNYDGQDIKIGYVGAYNYAEVVSGYTAFYLGIKSVVSNIKMKVQYTNSWFDYDKEYETAKSLIKEGCVIIGQHADSEGAPTACNEAYKKGTRVYSVGYNVDMLTAAPYAALTSATNNWEVYYTYAFYTALTSANGAKDIKTDWSEGYNQGAVAITDINGKVFKEDPSATIKAVSQAVQNGTTKVFNVANFTVGGQHLTTYTGAYGMKGAECLKTENEITYFNESVIRCAPYFDIRIDNITEFGAA